MPQSASKKGGLGTTSRRGPQKAHIPFRGDDLEHGKKTGKTVNKVLRDADDFEPFEAVLDQAYTGGNIPRAPNNNSKLVNGNARRGPSPILEDRDDGELSMEIDSTHNSPSAYFNTTVAPQPSSAKRVGSSSRALSRGSDVDYDRVPSPKPAPRRSSAKPLNPSRLRNEVQDNDTSRRAAAYDDSPDIEHSQMEFDYPEGDDVGVDDSPFLNTRKNTSFTELAQNDDDEDVDFPEDDESFVATRTDKGKGREVVRNESEEHEDAVVEDDIAADLQEVEDQPYGESDEDEPGPSNKRSRSGSDRTAPVSEPKKPFKKAKAQRTEQRLSIHETINEDGLRRSQRRHYPPLEYWRQEKVVWGRREKGPDKGPSYVPVIKEIITIPKPPPQLLGKNKRKRGGTRAPKSKSRSLAPDGPAEEEVRVVEVDNPEAGWDDATPSHGVIIDVETGEDVQRRVAFTAKMVKPVPAGNSNYLFQKIFGDGDFIAGGQLVIPPKQSKPAKPTKDNTYIFYLIEGAVQFRVHRSTFIIATGGMFLVPRGNQYYIENICERDAKLFFAQARKIVEGEYQGSPAPRARTTPRSSSQSKNVAKV